MKFFIQLPISYLYKDTVNNNVILSELGTDLFNEAGFKTDHYETTIEQCVENMRNIGYKLLNITSAFTGGRSLPNNFLNFIREEIKNVND